MSVIRAQASLAMLAVGCGGLNREAPAIAVGAQEGPVAAIAFQLEVSDLEPGLAGVEVSIDGGDAVALGLPDTAGVLAWAPQGVDDGAHTFVFTATDASWFRNRREVEVERVLDTQPPEVEVASSSLDAAQGRTWALWVHANEPLATASARAMLLGHDGDVAEHVVPLYPVGDAWRGLRGMEIKQEPGPVAVTIEATDALGHRATAEVQVTVSETAFEEGGYIRLTRKQKRARTDTEAIARMRKERNAAYAAALPDAAWTGPFRMPVEDSEQTSPFGKYRTYSDGRKSHHTGLDLDQVRGTPVLSTAAGKVLVAGEQAIFGNVVIVNHGHHVATSYNHLDTVSVAVGEVVEAGDPLGTLGSTGQSTGPHLHWGMEVGVVAVDPSEWMGNGFDVSPFLAPDP